MEHDQEQCLDDAIKVVKAQSFHIGKTIENNNLRSTLKEVAVMLAELKSGILTPRNYYALFSLVQDELIYLESFFKEECRRGRKVKHIYDSVQQAQSIIPRLYLTITAGRVYIDSGEINVKDIIFELLNMIKGVQNPTRGLFLRYYLLKMIKDKLPDNAEDLDTSIKFIIQNLEDMNRLWIRLSTGCSGNEKLLREKERNELKVLVGENIIRLSNLDSITLEKYRDDVLPKLVSMVLESKDTLSQQYLIECIIHAFSESYNIACMSTIMDTITKLVSSVDIKGLFINLMEKLAKFIGSDAVEEDQSNKFVEADKIIDLLKLNIDKLVEDNLGTQPTDELKIIELLVAFMKFALKSCPPNKKLETVNHILASGFTTLKGTSSQISIDTVKQTVKLLTLPLDHGISLFKLKLFAEIMNYLDFSSRVSLALNILDSLNLKNSDGSKKEVVDSNEKVNLLLNFIKPLTEKSPESVEYSKSDFTYEQTAVSKLIYNLKESNPKRFYEMAKLLQQVYIKGGSDRIKFTIPTLINSYISLINNVFASFNSKIGKAHGSSETAYHSQYLANYNIEFTDLSEVSAFVKEIYENILNLISICLIPIDYYNNVNIYFSVFSSLNNNYDLLMGDLANRVINTILTMITETKVDQSDKKLNNFNLIIAYLIKSRILSQDQYNSIVNFISANASTFLKRAEQSQIMLMISGLHFHDYYEKSEEKCKEALYKSIEYADYAMSTNSVTCLNLYIQIVCKAMFFFEKGATSVLSSKKMNKVLDKIHHSILTIKSEHKVSTTNLHEIEKFFESTLDVIKRRKTSSSNKIYADINLNFC